MRAWKSCSVGKINEREKGKKVEGNWGIRKENQERSDDSNWLSRISIRILFYYRKDDWGTLWIFITDAICVIHCDYPVTSEKRERAAEICQTDSRLHQYLDCSDKLKQKGRGYNCGWKTQAIEPQYMTPSWNVAIL